MDRVPTSPPLTSGATRDPRRPWAASPFTRLARTHAASVSGDALFAIGLAGSVFFSLDFTQARWRVALYLVLTIAPFAVAAPVIGPLIDRIKGGRRWIIVGSLAARAVLAYLVVQHMNTLWFYPEAFGMLIMQKVYSISKSAVVPGCVHSDEELVLANSKLTQLSAVAVVIAAIPGGIFYKIGGGEATVALGFVVFLFGTVLAFKLPPTRVAITPEDETEREELRSAGIMLASSAMGLIRGIVGFLSFMLAFDFKNDGAPLWQLGVVAATAQIGFFIGAVAAPWLRKRLVEERILMGSLVIMVLGGIATALLGGLFGAALLSALVGAMSSAAKQSFDSIVQRDAPDANRGRSFAKFETRFQLIWVIGALIPVVIPIPAAPGFALIATVALVAFASYFVGLRNLARGKLPARRRLFPRRRVAVVIDERHPAIAVHRSAADLGFSPDPSIFARSIPHDPVDKDGVVRHDAARRWMRLDAKVTSVFDEQNDDDTDVENGRPPRPLPQAQPEHRRRGRIFDPEAWDDDL